VRLSSTSAASSLGNSGTTFFRARCGVSVDTGDLIYLTGAVIGGYPEVDTVDIDQAGKNPAVGVVIKKRTSTECIIQVNGIIRNLFTGLTPGEFLFVNLSGGVTDTVPSPPPSGRRAIQNVGSALKANELLLDIKPPTYRIPQ